MAEADRDEALAALDGFEMELPSWGFADSGTRFGAFPQDAAAATIEQKCHDVGLVHKLTGACPQVAVHLAWDFDPNGDPAELGRLAQENGIRVGSINPTLFEDPVYKYGSLCSPQEAARRAALAHTEWGVDVGKRLGAPNMVLWLPDGTNYPGQDSIYQRKHRLQDALRRVHDRMRDEWPEAQFLLEYKPFEPAFYHTDVADWGMSYALCRRAGERARVLVDTGHHLPGCNLEHIVAFLLDEGMLGGFHFNDRKYADDDLTMGSIAPYQAFRIFDQLAQHEFETGERPDIAFMIDQAHNIKPKIEAMVQTVCEAQKQFLRARLVDRERLARAQQACDVVAAEGELKAAFETPVEALLAEWRRARGLPEDPVAALRGSGIVERLARERVG